MRTAEAGARHRGAHWYECFKGDSPDAVVWTFARLFGHTGQGGERGVRQPSILDVVHAVKSVAPAHPEVAAWWYTPPQRLRLAGDLPGSAGASLSLEVVVEGTPAALAEAPCAQIARELSAALSGVTVTTRTHRGDREERPLFRIVSPGRKSSSNEAPRPA
jgi:hypothetical protein